MKAVAASIAALSLLQLAAAQPHRRNRHANHHLEKKDIVYVTQTVVAQATDDPQVIIYVDSKGNPVSTVTKGHAVVIATQAPAPPPPASSSSIVVIPSTTSIPTIVVPTTAASSAAPSVVSSSAAASSSAATIPSNGGGSGLTYSPYNSDGTCKTASQVLQDFEGFGSGYSFIRSYGVDCSTVPNVLAACKAHGLKFFVGIFSISGLESQVSAITSAFAGDYSSLYAVSVGNELVNNGAADALTMVAAVKTVRALLRTAGFTGPVLTVDTLVAARANPILCDASDICAVNCHPYFDGTVSASEAGAFITTQIATLRAVLANPNQQILISETGWPSKGQSNNAAIASPANQATAISSIRAAFSSNPAGLTLFNPYNMHWKTSSAGQFDAEPFWGFLGECPSG